MLMLDAYAGESVYMENTVTKELTQLFVSKVSINGKTKLGFEAPKHVKILRGKVYDKRKAELAQTNKAIPQLVNK